MFLMFFSIPWDGVGVRPTYYQTHVSKPTVWKIQISEKVKTYSFRQSIILMTRCVYLEHKKLKNFKKNTLILLHIKICFKQELINEKA
jgi:hypothetical protein